MVVGYYIEDLTKTISHFYEKFDELITAVDDFSILYGLVHGYTMDGNGKWRKITEEDIHERNS